MFDTKSEDYPLRVLLPGIAVTLNPRENNKIVNIYLKLKIVCSKRGETTPATKGKPGA
jgi:hypothetical protein